MSWTRRLINTLRRRTLERAIDDELQFHVELRAADLQRAGRSADDARREARRLLGNDLSLRDRTREADVRTSCRSTAPPGSCRCSQS
jgi:hypothetical protein